MHQKKINIIIAFDQQLIADGLSAILAREKEINVVGCIKNGNSVSEHTSKNKPDLVLFEFARWPSHYISYIREFSMCFNKSKLLLISELISHDYLIEVMSIAHGYLLRTCSSDRVLLAIHEINNSGKYICPQEVEAFVNNKTKGKGKLLTSREEEVLSHWVTYDTSNEIARILNISESTVRTHLKNVRQKMEGTNKIEMLIYACKNNILNLGREPICPNCKFSCSKLEAKFN